MIDIGNGIKLYSSGEEISSARYTKFQKYLAMESSIVERLERIKAFLLVGDTDGAKTEIENGLFSLNQQVNGVNGITYAFAIMVAEIGGKAQLDISDAGLAVVVERLKDIPIQEASGRVSEFKKKVNDEIETLFPSFRSTYDTLSLIAIMKDYIMSVEFTNFDDEWEREQLELKYSQIVTESGVFPISKIERDFYALCGLMEENGSSKPEEYSIIRFYSKLDYISEKNKKQDERRD